MTENSCLIMTDEENEAYQELQEIFQEEGEYHYTYLQFHETSLKDNKINNIQNQMHKKFSIINAALCFALSPLTFLFVFLSK